MKDSNEANGTHGTNEADVTNEAHGTNSFLETYERLKELRPLEMQAGTTGEQTEFISRVLEHWQQMQEEHGQVLSEEHWKAYRDLAEVAGTLVWDDKTELKAGGPEYSHIVHTSACGTGKTTFVKAFAKALTEKEMLPFNNAGEPLETPGMLIAAERVDDLATLYRELQELGVNPAMIHSKRGNEVPLDRDQNPIHSAPANKALNTLVLLVTHEYLRSRQRDPETDYMRYGYYMNPKHLDCELPLDEWNILNSRILFWDESYLRANTYMPAIQKTGKYKSLIDQFREAQDMHRRKKKRAPKNIRTEKMLSSDKYKKSHKWVQETLRVLEDSLDASDGDWVEIPECEVPTHDFFEALGWDQKLRVQPEVTSDEIQKDYRENAGPDIRRMNEIAGGRARVMEENDALYLYTSSKAVHPALKKMIVLDASGVVSPFVELNKQLGVQPGFQPDCSDVTLHYRKQAAGRYTHSKAAGRENTWKWVQEILKRNPDKETLILVHKDDAVRGGTKAKLKAEEEYLTRNLSMHLEKEREALRRPAEGCGADVHILHWGAHKSSNEFNTCEVVIVPHMHYLPSGQIRGKGYAETGKFTAETPRSDLDAEDWALFRGRVHELQKQSLLDYTLQGVGRGSLRNIQEGKAQKCDVYIQDQDADWICNELQEHCFPNCEVVHPEKTKRTRKQPALEKRTELLQKAARKLLKKDPALRELYCKDLKPLMQQLDPEPKTGSYAKNYYTVSYKDFPVIQVRHPDGREQVFLREGLSMDRTVLNGYEMKSSQKYILQELKEV